MNISSEFAPAGEPCLLGTCPEAVLVQLVSTLSLPGQGAVVTTDDIVGNHTKHSDIVFEPSGTEEVIQIEDSLLRQD